MAERAIRTVLFGVRPEITDSEMTFSSQSTVDGVGEARARSVRDARSRLAESSILDRYQ